MRGLLALAAILVVLLVALGIALMVEAALRAVRAAAEAPRLQLAGPASMVIGNTSYVVTLPIVEVQGRPVRLLEVYVYTATITGAGLLRTWLARAPIPGSTSFTIGVVLCNLTANSTRLSLLPGEYAVITILVNCSSRVRFAYAYGVVIATSSALAWSARPG